MDFIDRALPPRALAVLERAVHVAVAAMFFFLGWQVLIKAGRISQYGDTTDVLGITVGPFVYFMAAMIFLSGAVHVVKIFLPGERRSAPPTT
jgi:hypothetical protein